MNYIIFDMEWNSVRVAGNNGFLNEVIEIGAVKLDSDFNIAATFSSFVKPAVGKKLNKYVTGLTHISDEQLKNAEDFAKVFKNFSEWAGDSAENVFMSWSDTDLHVLIDNFKFFLQRPQIDFMSYYCDLQKYITRFIKKENNNQISLSAAAEYFEIDISDIAVHRALDDSIICARLLQMNYNAELFAQYVRKTDFVEFYERLLFKPFYVTDISSEDVDKREFCLSKCPSCGAKPRLLSEFVRRYNGFSGDFVCENCKKKYNVIVRFKKYYDNVKVSSKTKEIVPKKVIKETAEYNKQ